VFKRWERDKPQQEREKCARGSRLSRNHAKSTNGKRSTGANGERVAQRKSNPKEEGTGLPEKKNKQKPQENDLEDTEGRDRAGGVGKGVEKKKKNFFSGKYCTNHS